MYYAINKKEYTLRFLLKMIAVISTIYGLSKGFMRLDNYTYFTYQSNILIALILFIAAIFDLKAMKVNHKIEHSTYYYMIKFMATISITITLVVFAFILAPVLGGYYQAYFGMDQGGSFCLHFLTPMIAIIDFLFYDNEYLSRPAHALVAIVPAILYVVFVVVMGQLFNYRWGEMIAPYNFLNYGAPCGWFGINLTVFDNTTVGIGVFYMIIILIMIFIIVGSIFLWINKKLHHTRNYY